MSSNIEKYKKDLEKLIKHGESLQTAMEYDCYPEQYEEALGDKLKSFKKTLP